MLGRDSKDPMEATVGAPAVATKKEEEELEMQTVEEATTQALLALHRHRKRPQQPQLMRQSPHLQQERARKLLFPRRLPQQKHGRATQLLSRL